VKTFSPQMNAEERRYLHADLTEKIIGVFYDVYKELGYGFLESVYEQAMFIALQERGLDVQRQVPVPVWFRGHRIGDFQADLVIARVVIVEMKAARNLDTPHEAQLLNYLRATEIELGLLLNFGPRPGIRRLAFSNERKQISVPLRSSAAKENG
jgi:GxxExxY protein